MEMTVSNFDELIQQVKQKNVKDGGKKKVAVMCADDEEVLAALVEARDSGVADSFLVGNKERTERVYKRSLSACRDFSRVRRSKEAGGCFLLRRKGNGAKRTLLRRGRGDWI